MFIVRKEFYTDIYPFVDENTRPDVLAWQPSIHVFDTDEKSDNFGEVRWHGQEWTEAMFEKLTIAFAKAFELAKAAREINDAKK